MYFFTSQVSDIRVTKFYTLYAFNNRNDYRFCFLYRWFCCCGGNPVSLIHAGEIMIICGIGLGILVVSSPKSVLMNLRTTFLRLSKVVLVIRANLLTFSFCFTSCLCLGEEREHLHWMSMLVTQLIVQFSQNILPSLMIQV